MREGGREAVGILSLTALSPIETTPINVSPALNIYQGHESFRDSS